MPIVRLPERALITVAGPDAEHLLQNVITTDLEALGEGELKPGALLTPQGKIMFDFLISRAGGDALRLDVRAEIADDFVKRLMLYRLRAKAEIFKQDRADVIVGWGDESGRSDDDSTSAGWLVDTRFQEIRVWRSYGSDVQTTDEPRLWTRLRIEHGIAESGADYQLGEAFPHDVLLDQLGGVGFRKGCYIGQEVVSRMQHRGTARRRALIMNGSDALPGPGTPVTIDGREAGTLGSVAGNMGLAICRIDRIKDALDAARPILAAGVSLSPEIPRWAKFHYPEAAQPEGL